MGNDFNKISTLESWFPHYRKQMLIRKFVWFKHSREIKSLHLGTLGMKIGSHVAEYKKEKLVDFSSLSEEEKLKVKKVESFKRVKSVRLYIALQKNRWDCLFCTRRWSSLYTHANYIWKRDSYLFVSMISSTDGLDRKSIGRRLRGSDAGTWMSYGSVSQTHHILEQTDKWNNYQRYDSFKCYFHPAYVTIFSSS